MSRLIWRAGGKRPSPPPAASDAEVFTAGTQRASPQSDAIARRSYESIHDVPQNQRPLTARRVLTGARSRPHSLEINAILKNSCLNEIGNDFGAQVIRNDHQDKKGVLVAFYTATNRFLRDTTPARAVGLIVVLATILAVISHLSLHVLSLYLLGLPTGEVPLAVVMVDAGLAAIITSLPIVAYCMGLVRRLRETKYQLKLAAAAAEAANSAKSVFLANMSHEIRTPLNGVLGMTDVLSREALTPHQANCLQTIRESGKTLMAILNDLLDLSKIEAGKLEISDMDASPRAVFFSLHKLFLPRAQEKDIELTLQIDKSVPQRARFDTVRVRQCVANLVFNAIKFTARGEVTVAVAAMPTFDGQHLITVDVADTGIGLSQETMDRLFMEFAQADISTSRQFGGTGLGLAITRKLARLMGGDVAVRSTPGMSTVFSLTFQAAPAENMGDTDEGFLSAEFPAGDEIMDGVRVLLVDDNPINREVVRLLLKPANMDIIDAENGKAALDLLARQPFELVLLDVHMPVMDGITTIKLIRDSTESWRSVPVIALTADAMSGDRERLLSLGMTGYVSKPVDQVALVREILRVFGADMALRPGLRRYGAPRA